MQPEEMAVPAAGRHGDDCSGRTVEVEAALRAATCANPAFAEAWYNLADLLDDQGRSEAAIECFINIWPAIVPPNGRRVHSDH
jgi:tetratricopeptide (TPR) repeat protein